MSLMILALWTFVAQDLFRRDILPELLVGPPPDFRSILNSDRTEPSEWTILVKDERSETGGRPVGRVLTESLRRRDESIRLSSVAWFDAEGLLAGTPFSALEQTRIEVLSSFEVDSTGNLEAFRSSVREGYAAKTELVVIEGRLRNDQLELSAKSPLPLLSWRRSIPYRSHSLVETSLGPLDRLPGLRVGQRWESRVVSPLSGRVETCRVEVARKRYITWGGNPTATFEVVSRIPPLTARTWVRTDGLVLRQEVPFPLVKLILERQGEPAGTGAGAGAP
jgi:hypothetical protein